MLSTGLEGILRAQGCLCITLVNKIIIMFWNIFKKKTAKSLPSNNEANFLLSSNKKIKATRKHKIPVSFLKKLSPLDQLLTEKEIQKLPLAIVNFLPGTVIFNKGTEVDSLIYIIKGSIVMDADNGYVLEISADTFKAQHPLSSGKQHYFTATAKSDVTVIYLSKDILQRDQSAITLLNNELKISDALKDNLFFSRFYKNFSHGVQTFPKFPEIALKLRTAIQDDCGIDEIVKIVRLDPIISAKLINAANSAMYRSVNPISSCFDAINRIGLRSTCYMVTAFSMTKLASSENPSIQQLIQRCWLQSIKVSSISYILAELTQNIDPEEALIAGLLHNIGTFPILTFADRFQGISYQSADIDLCINEIQGQIGSIVLENWGFPPNLSKIPLQSTNWFANLTEDLNLNDIVLLAKYHALLPSPSGNAELPLLITLPAFQKLKNRSLTPEMSLQILDDAKQKITETMNFFS